LFAIAFSWTLWKPLHECHRRPLLRPRLSECGHI
jgi:hypothetical protein